MLILFKAHQLLGLLTIAIWLQFHYIMAEGSGTNSPGGTTDITRRRKSNNPRLSPSRESAETGGSGSSSPRVSRYIINVLCMQQLDLQRLQAWRRAYCSN